MFHNNLLCLLFLRTFIIVEGKNFCLLFYDHGIMELRALIIMESKDWREGSYKPIRADNFHSNNYIEHESSIDRIKSLLIEE